MGTNGTTKSALTRLPAWLATILGSTSAAVGEEQPQASEAVAVETPENSDVAEADTAEPRVPTGDISTVVDEMLSQHRYALLLRPQLIKSLSHEQLARTRTALSEGMCLVPEGQVVLRHTPLHTPAEKDPHHDGHSLQVDAFYLDRFPVTNLQYFQFVTGGGYEQMAIWDPEIWPALLDFVDQTGHPGPRFWHKGRYPRGEEHHPVVGVSWYEAVAFSRWAGKRLPTDPEWVKAGSWPVSIQGHPLLLRRYPWGEAMDHNRANVWGSGPGRSVSVFEFPGGVSVGGVHQLIGNVWEWTADSLACEDGEASGAAVPTRMKSIRGGAFDTYLDCQATCHFASADVALARKHNIGFRAAIGMCDLEVRSEPSAESHEWESDDTSYEEN